MGGGVSGERRPRAQRLGDDAREVAVEPGCLPVQRGAAEPLVEHSVALVVAILRRETRPGKTRGMECVGWGRRDGACAWAA